jgi:hypothetical protein
MTKNFNTAESFRTWANTMGIGETIWQGFQIITKQGPMIRSTTANGLTLNLRLEQAGNGYRATLNFSG